MAFCKNCGQQLVDGAAFCANCGTPIESAPQATTPVQAETPVQATEPKQQEPPKAQEAVQQPQSATLTLPIPKGRGFLLPAV